VADVTEQAARLNTLMRFHQYGDALPFAYKYRLDLQLTAPKSAQVDKALRGVEEVIAQLERNENKWKRLGKMFWGLVVGKKPGAKEEPSAIEVVPAEKTAESDAEQPGEE